MPELNDHELLAEFARNESEAAFAALVARHVNLVYTAALRHTGNRHHAEEITQAVFIILARKAGGLRRGTVLSGWLYQTARLTAANFMKGEIRRQRREQEAYMQSTLNEPDAAAWEEIAPLLDEAMGRLGETDRNAIVLRFFENKTASEVAATLQMNESAAHKRVTRGLEKTASVLHQTRRGIDGGDDWRGVGGQLRAGRARRVKRVGCRSRQRCGADHFDFRDRQRSVEGDGVGEIKYCGHVGGCGNLGDGNRRHCHQSGAGLPRSDQTIHRRTQW